MYTPARLAELVPFPVRDCHKYSRGKAVVVAGSSAYPGAALLSSWASQLCGAGYTEVFTSRSNKALIQMARPSLVVRCVSDCSFADVFASLYPGACLVGPGIDPADHEMHAVLSKALKKVEKPLVIDGGALSLLAEEKVYDLVRKRFRKNRLTVLTPHAGEAARLAAPFGIDGSDQQSCARSLARCYGAVVVYKGPETVITDGDVSDVFTEGTPALAKAGTGDVLAGIITSLLAQGLTALDAANLGVAIHGRAGNVACERVGMVSVCAEDVLDAVPAAIRLIASA